MSYSWSESPQQVQVLAIQDWLLDEDMQQLFAEIEARICAGKCEFVVDLSQTALVNSMGLGMLIRLLTQARSAGGEAIIAQISPKIRQILLVTRLQTTFIVKDSLQEALSFFEKTTTG